MIKKVQLIDIDWPVFGVANRPVEISCIEFENRISSCLNKMNQSGISHVLIYADREHFANLAYLTGFEPRFEEALLLISQNRKPLLLAGNESFEYLSISPVYLEKKILGEKFQPFSLIGQPRENSRQLKDIFDSEGLNIAKKIGCVGWKYFSAKEMELPINAIELPAYIVDILRQFIGKENVVNATDLFMHPDYGLRAKSSVNDIAYFEFTNTLASDGMNKALHSIQPGMLDYELAKCFDYCGEPLGCYPTMSLNDRLGLGGPRGRIINEGDSLATNLCYWGSNTCRAGWVVKDEHGLPPKAKNYVSEFAGPYFAAMGEWFENLKIGNKGHVLFDIIQKRLPFDKFGIYLNPGHLIHLDEWLSTPIFDGSQIKLQSGMVFQSDVIPSSPHFGSTRMEDGFALADKGLQEQLQNNHPEVYERIQKRRTFMIEVLGIALPYEVLPLSNMAGIVCPYFLSPNKVFKLV